MAAVTFLVLHNFLLILLNATVLTSLVAFKRVISTPGVVFQALIIIVAVFKTVLWHVGLTSSLQRQFSALYRRLLIVCSRSDQFVNGVDMAHYICLSLHKLCSYSGRLKQINIAMSTPFTLYLRLNNY